MVLKNPRIVIRTNTQKRSLNAQKYVDNEVLRRCNPLVPFKTGTLVGTGKRNKPGEVTYNTPYAKKQYYQGRTGGQRGRLWFARMKASNKEDILRGAKKHYRE